MAALRTLTRRMQTFSQHSKTENEKQILETIAVNNGYNNSIIDKLLKQTGKPRVNVDDHRHRTFVYNDRDIQNNEY